MLSGCAFYPELQEQIDFCAFAYLHAFRNTLNPQVCCVSGTTSQRANVPPQSQTPYWLGVRTRTQLNFRGQPQVNPVMDVKALGTNLSFTITATLHGCEVGLVFHQAHWLLTLIRLRVGGRSL